MALAGADEVAAVREKGRRGSKAEKADKGSGELPNSQISKSSYQPSLFNVRFGPARSKRRAGVDEQPAPQTKRRRAGSEEAERKEGQPGVGTTVDSRELHPVRQPAFLANYSVEGLEDVYYQRDWVDAKTALRWQSELEGLEAWYRPTLKVYGREIVQSRSIAAYATAPGLELKYSGHQVDMHAPFPPLLEQIAARLSTESCLGSDVKFNHAMLNSYQDGQVYIGRHSDNVENQVIVTVSLGAPRSWIMEEKKPRGSKEKGKRHKWTLENGSLLVMQGSVQKRYTHEIPKEASVKSPRISITFRQLVYG